MPPPTPYFAPMDKFVAIAFAPPGSRWLLSLEFCFIYIGLLGFTVSVVLVPLSILFLIAVMLTDLFNWILRILRTYGHTTHE